MGKNKKKQNKSNSNPNKTDIHTDKDPLTTSPDQNHPDNIPIESLKLEPQSPSPTESTSENLDNAKLVEKLKATEQDRDEIQQSYDNLVSKLTSMKTVFTKMKQSEEELESKNELVEKLMSENQELKKQVTDSNNGEIQQLKEENLTLNNECEKLSDSLTKSRREYNSTIEQLQDDKYNLENQNSKLNKKIAELKQEINEINVNQNELKSDSQNYVNVIDDLKKKLQSKENYVKESNKNVEELNLKLSNDKMSTAKQVEVLNLEIQQLKASLASNVSTIDSLKEKIVDNEIQLEKSQEESKQIHELKSEITNKQLAIGKLRHEAIILNEHLTKALTMLKQGGEGSSKNTVDTELISNIIISFLQFPRGDSKKFEALQLISALLNWDHQQKIAAGLVQTHKNKNSQNLPPKLDKDGNEIPSRQSFVSLWTEFLEKESSGK